MGIYTDGSLKNSSFDLMKDLETIHQIIFSKDIPYVGTPNSSAQSVNNFFLSSQAMLEGLKTGMSLSDRLSQDLADSGWKLVQEDPTDATSKK